MSTITESQHALTGPRTYFVIFALLLGLTLTTVLVAEADLGLFHTHVAMLIAFAKATLVVLFFMHVIHSHRLTWLVIAASLFFLSILLLFTFVDYLSRSWIAVTGA